MALTCNCCGRVACGGCGDPDELAPARVRVDLSGLSWEFYGRYFHSQGAGYTPNPHIFTGGNVILATVPPRNAGTPCYYRYEMLLHTYTDNSSSCNGVPMKNIFEVEFPDFDSGGVSARWTVLLRWRDQFNPPDYPANPLTCLNSGSTTTVNTHYALYRSRVNVKPNCKTVLDAGITCDWFHSFNPSLYGVGSHSAHDGMNLNQWIIPATVFVQAA